MVTIDALCWVSLLTELSNDPIVKSFEPGEGWAWCYIDKTDV